MRDDNYYMGVALGLSEKAKGMTSPNPLVGAVIAKNNKIIAKGFHKRAGLPHAEPIAIKKAGRNAKGATLYVSLEPCSTFGRTPACTDTIIKSGIKKVVVAMIDPNPEHRGRGIKILQKHGIAVRAGVLEARARVINQPFIKYCTRERPYVTVKIAQSLDGKIATARGESKWITSPAARQYSRRLRSQFDAIMVGSRTVLADNPSLSPEGAPPQKKFYKIIIDTSLKIKPAFNVFKDANRFPVIVATSKESIVRKEKQVRALCEKGAIVLGIEKKNGLLSLDDLLHSLAQLEITTILAEGGGSLIGSLFDEDLIDAALFFIRPALIGGAGALSGIQGRGIQRISQMKMLRNVELGRIAEELVVEGLLKKY